MTNLNNTPQRVVVAMSGGVDSSVAAALLVKQGYEVIGMMMRLWSEPSMGDQPAMNRCCTPDQMADARRVANQLDIPFYVLDVKDYFRHSIVQFFIDEHEQGRTPNPCIECNRQIRFTYLLQQALALDADFLATGHYAQVVKTAVNYQLRQGVDPAKDQSYVLHMLTQQHLAHVLFPIGQYTKSEVREMARQFGLPVASKQESQDLCFLGDNDYRRFLRQYGQQAAPAGDIVDENGRFLGHHTGLPFYTIGQRKGLGISSPEPLYVIAKNTQHNTLIVAPRERLGQQRLRVRGVNWITGEAPAKPIQAAVKIRYKAAGATATVAPLPHQEALVTFAEPVFGITPGQGAVFFDGPTCLGGGIIADYEQDGGNAQTIPLTLHLP